MLEIFFLSAEGRKRAVVDAESVKIAAQVGTAFHSCLLHQSPGDRVVVEGIRAIEVEFDDTFTVELGKIISLREIRIYQVYLGDGLPVEHPGNSRIPEPEITRIDVNILGFKTVRLRLIFFNDKCIVKMDVQVHGGLGMCSQGKQKREEKKPDRLDRKSTRLNS